MSNTPAMTATYLSPTLTMARYTAMSLVRRTLPSLAWTSIAVRLEMAAKLHTGGVAQKLRDRADDARGRSDRSRIAKFQARG